MSYGHSTWGAQSVVQFPSTAVTNPAQKIVALLSTIPLQYVPKTLFTQATIDCLTVNKTKNALHNKAVILNYELVVTKLVVNVL